MAIQNNITDPQELIKSMIVYSDVNLQAASIGGNGLVYNERSVYNRLYSLFTTPTRARVMLRRYGTDILPLLFEPFDQYTAARIKDEIYRGVKAWEVDLGIVYRSIDVLANEDNGTYDVTVRVMAGQLEDGESALQYSFQHAGQ